jgi:hypothetical protein
MVGSAQEAFMNRIVKEHYPASKLPEDLREGLDPGAKVMVTIVEEEKVREKVLSLDELFAMRRTIYRSGAELDAELRRQREEWDD